MTERPRVRDILASYGGRDDRWPPAERAAVLAALRDDAGLRAERDAALHLDALLDEWATRDVRGDAGAAAARVLSPPRRWPRWVAGGSVAAALGLTVMIAGPATRSDTPAIKVATLTDEGAFAAVFTTTPDEESVL